MAHASPRSPLCPAATACRRLARDPGLPFAEHLPEADIEGAVRGAGASFRRRLFRPALTLWAFLSQGLDPAHSCRAAVARLLAWRLGRGLAPCSADSGGYCKARARLPEDALAGLARDRGRRVLEQAPAPWLWHGRPAQVIDGTGLGMPDPPANRREYAPHGACRPGCGFP
jgi:hypothetical protein